MEVSRPAVCAIGCAVHDDDEKVRRWARDFLITAAWDKDMVEASDASPCPVLSFVRMAKDGDVQNLAGELRKEQESLAASSNSEQTSTTASASSPRLGLPEAAIVPAAEALDSPPRPGHRLPSGDIFLGRPSLL